MAGGLRHGHAGGRFLGSFRSAGREEEVPEGRYTSPEPLLSGIDVYPSTSVLLAGTQSHDHIYIAWLCAEEEKEAGFIEHVAISASEFVPCRSRIAQ